MNEDIFAGKWHQIKGKVKEKWGKLTDDDLTTINGNREQLLGSLEEKYGWQKQRAEDELKKFEKMFKEEAPSKREPLREYKKENEELYKGESDEERGEGRSKKRKIG